MSPTSTSHPAYYGPAFADARVNDAMRVGLVTCRPSASPADAARMMAGYGIHCLILADPATGGHTQPLGVVDALDVARGEADGRERIEEIATEPITIDSDAPLADAARSMAERRTPISSRSSRARIGPWGWSAPPVSPPCSPGAAHDAAARVRSPIVRTPVGVS